MAADQYSCSLSEKTLIKAKDELHEDPDERLGSVRTLREWTEREPWITAPSDPRFLLAFLRCGKFSQLSARDRLSNFLATFSGAYSFMKGHDPGDEKSLEILRDYSMFVLPQRNRDGCGIIFGKIGAIDVSGRYSYEEFTAAFMPLMHSLMFFDEEIQVNGLVFFMDFGGVTMSLMTWMGLDAMMKNAEYTNKSAPARIKDLNYYNTGPAFEAFIAIFKPLLAEKIRNRVHVHHTMVSVYEKIDTSALPEEYLPDDYKGPSAGKIKDIVEKNIKELLLDPERRAFLKELYSGKYSADLKKRPTETETMASFRKLNVS